jgi:Uma2 family endonuclease
MYLTITDETVDLPPGAEVVLRHQSWSDYETLLHSRRDRAAIKLYFDAATAQEIRIMAPLPEHRKKSDTLSDLVKCLLRHQGLDYESFDPITLKRSGQQGAEPDACFYIQNRLAILGKTRIDLDQDPPPDLAIEIDQTSSTLAADYQPLGIPELWIYRRQTLLIYCFDGQRYVEQSASPLFPNIQVKDLIADYVERAWTIGSSIALREFETMLKAL